MDRILIDTTDSPDIVIKKVSGTLRLKGWDRPQIRADMETEDTLESQIDGNTITISSSSGCLLRVPNDSAIEIGEVSNDLVIKSIDGKISVKRVLGQVMVKSIGCFYANEVLGNLNARLIQADLECKKTSGNVNAKDVDGQIVLNKINGNLSVTGFTAGLKANADGNANLLVEPECDGEYIVTAAGNISYRLPPFSNARLLLKTQGGKIRLNIKNELTTINTNKHEVILGTGESLVDLKAHGNIDIVAADDSAAQRDYYYDFDELTELTTLADDITQLVSDQIETQMNGISRQVQELTSSLSNLDANISESQRRSLEAKRRSLERKLASVERKALHKAKKAERRLERRKSMHSFTVVNEPVTDQERQKVLEMLQNRQISVAEAEVLLSALEGGAPDRFNKPAPPDMSSEPDQQEE